MPKIYAMTAKINQIAHDAATRLATQKDKNGLPFINEDVFHAQIDLIGAEIEAQGGQAIPAGAVPQAMTIQLSCGLVYIVTPDYFVIDVNETGILRA